VFYDYESDNMRNLSSQVPKAIIQSNQLAELLTLKEAMEMVDTENELRIELDSKYGSDSVTKYLRKLENQGFRGIAHGSLPSPSIETTKRTTPTMLEWIKGHNKHE
jgi:ribonuclease HI